MMNLCTNAGHAMADTAGILDVSLQNIELKTEEAALYSDLTAGPYVKLSISDTGHGMDSRTMDRIFDPYFTTKAQDKGTGMGLAVVHGIIKGHGGSIHVESVSGKGSRFDIFFPIMERQTVSETEELKALPTGSECILLVDDEDSLIDLGQNMLKKLGYRVEPWTRPVEALEAFRADPHKFDLVISDMTMPNMTGDILSTKLRQIRGDIPIIICTGYSEKINEQRADELGIQGLIMKPFTIRRLARKVREVLDGKS
jgi:CheY-like chemotaxis protein